MRIGICPFVRKRSAFIGFDGVYPATVVLGEPDAGIVVAAPEDEAAPVWCDFRLF